MKHENLNKTFAFAAALAVSLTCCAQNDGDVSQKSRSALAGAAPAYPFGSRVDSYRFGTKPNHVTTAQMDERIRAHYNDWKAHLLVDVPTVPGGKAIKFNQAGYLTVSEGMGYGMLLTVLMAGYDPDAQTIFDGLLETARARPAYSIPDANVRPYLMDWRLAGDGSSTDAAGGGWNALDGDEDIAMALLMANRQWGSTGTWNYEQEGIRTINAMKAWNMKPDGTPMANLRTSRTSDYMIGHFRAYAAATGDGFWNTAVDRAYTLVDRMQTVYSPNVGLVPDFIVNTDTSSPQPSPGGQIESPWEGHYFSNGQRDPWRWATDYVYSGDTRWKSVLSKMTDFFVRDNGGTPGVPGTAWDPIGNMAIGYHLDGTRMNSEFSNPWPARGVVAGAMNGAQVDAKYQTYVNACWDWLDAKWIPAYYDAELTLLSMIVASGNWWNPTAPSGSAAPSPPPPTSTSVSTSTSTRIQAEDAALSGSVSVHSDLAGFEGTGFVGSFANAGDQLTASFTNVRAGTYPVNIRYHAWTAQENTLVINGASRSESFPATGSGWATKTVSDIPLTDGTNAVSIVKDWGYIDVDYIEIGTGSTTSTSSSPNASTIRLQAEAGSLSGTGVSVRTDLAGYDGSGFVADFSASGDRLALSFAGVAAGTYQVRIRYQAWTAQQNSVTINGALRSESFPATGSSWVVKTLTGVTLPSGTSTVVLSKDWGYMSVDWVEIGP